LIYETEKGTRVACRPSGTEPKIKFYIGVKGTVTSIEDITNVEQTLDNKIQRIIKQLGV